MWTQYLGLPIMVENPQQFQGMQFPVKFRIGLSYKDDIIELSISQLNAKSYIKAKILWFFALRKLSQGGKSWNTFSTIVPEANNA